MFHFVFAAYMLGNTSLAEQRFLGGLENYADEVGRPVASVIAALVIASLGVVLLAAGLARPVSPIIVNATTIAMAAVAAMFFWLDAWPVALVAVLSAPRSILSPEPHTRHHNHDAAVAASGRRRRCCTVLGGMRIH